MPVIISNGNTNLTTANGFYRVEAHNLGTFSATDLVLSTTRTISVTFANAGNCLGIVLPLPCNVATTVALSTLRGVTVTLREGGTVRATATLTATQIANGASTPISNGGYIVPFIFSSPYAVTTAPGTWTFDVVSSAGSEANHFSIRTSNGTAPSYATWCNNAISFATGDTVICKDIVTVNHAGTARFGAVLGTGDSTNGVCGWVCKSSTPPTLAGANSNLQWNNSAARTLQIDGMLVYGSHSGIQFNSSSSRGTFANLGTLEFVNRTVGTTSSGIYTPEGTLGSNDHKNSIWIYGQPPTVRKCTLSADASVGSATFQTNDNVSSDLVPDAVRV